MTPHEDRADADAALMLFRSYPRTESIVRLPARKML